MFIWWNKLLGRKVIACRRIRDGEWWYSVVRRDPWGERCAWRYSFNRIGHVTLNEDGTGEYCGEIVWKPV